jgi:phospholipid/cholesterol/gamma-HCH transport system ATP-binding protein
MEKIKFSSVYKSFGEKSVLRDLNFTVAAGESVVIIGRSGCGKSVMLKHMVGLIRPDKGKVFVDGEDITTMNQKNLYRIRGKFGFLFQSSALLDSLTVGENVGLGLIERSSLPPADIRRIVTEKLDMVGMRGTEDIMPADLSGGMRKRVGLARAIAMDPEIILYDEPTTGLDPIMGDTINELIVRLKHDLNITSVSVTHDMVSARKIADRIAMLENGEIVFSGSINDLDQSDITIVRQFVNGRCEYADNLQQEESERLP